MACFITRHYTNNSITNTSTQQMTGTGKSPASPRRTPCGSPIAFLYFIIAQAQGKRKGGPQKCCRAAAILTSAPSYFTMNTKGVFTMSRDSIKMVAMLTMLINHIANVFLPAGQVWEAVGCAVPILVSAFVILYLYNGRRAARGRTFYKWFFYAFYPAHLLVLGLLRLAV